MSASPNYGLKTSGLLDAYLEPWDRDHHLRQATIRNQAAPWAETGDSPMGAPQVTDKTFEAEVLKSAEPVLVDFFAEWCGPCKAMAPALDQVAAEMKGKLKVVKVDVDLNPEITMKYRISAMPTLMIFKDGKVAAQNVGALVQKAKLEAWVKSSVTIA
jgi:thioredoxin 1